jgi:hypothetical protein
MAKILGGKGKLFSMISLNILIYLKRNNFNFQYYLLVCNSHFDQFDGVHVSWLNENIQRCFKNLEGWTDTGMHEVTSVHLSHL